MLSLKVGGSAVGGLMFAKLAAGNQKIEAGICAAHQRPLLKGGRSAVGGRGFALKCQKPYILSRPS